MPFDVQQPQTFAHLETQPISGGVGAEISGVDLAASAGNDGVIQEIREALLRHGVIFFRDQTLQPEQLIAVARSFGPLNIHPIYLPLDGYPEIMPVVKEATATMNIGNSWHSDVSFMEKPSLGSLLYALDVPAYGGDTIFASQRLAYDGLSEGMREMLDGMYAIHSDRILSSAESKRKRNAGRSTKLDEAPTPEVQNRHPVIRTIPETGVKHLYVNEAFTIRFDGMTESESKPLLEELYTHARKPEFTCRFQWRKGSVAFWDNRAVQHYAINDYQGFRREMWRVTIEGERPV